MIERYQTKEITLIYKNRPKLWRALWLALAEEQQMYGLPITDVQLNDLRDTADDWMDDAEFDRLEREVQHDVMARLKEWRTFADEGSKALHLGCTSCFVTDNSDAMIYQASLNFVKGRVEMILNRLLKFIKQNRSVYCLGYTHFQPAQPITMGWRGVIWMQDLEMVWRDLCAFRVPFRGIQGAVGSQASFKTLGLKPVQISEINRNLARRFGFEEAEQHTTQTYSRYYDSKMMKILSLVAEVASKFAHDIRLLSHTGEACESRDAGQAGSSAMPYKSNPVNAEKICALARQVIANSQSISQTYATQWLDRSLDDSSIRRVAIHDNFHLVCHILDSMNRILDKLVVNEERCSEILREHHERFIREDMMMGMVLEGRNRLDAHADLTQRTIDPPENLNDLNVGTVIERIDAYLSQRQVVLWATS